PCATICGSGGPGPEPFVYRTLTHDGVQLVKRIRSNPRSHAMRTVLRTLVLLLALPALAPSVSWSQAPPNDLSDSGELLDAGHRLFGGVSRGLATIIEKAVSQWGLPNGYVLGEEAGGAFFGGLRYGEGTLYTKNAGDLKVYFQGPSLGWD